jgi:hypothetical protein
MRLLMTVEPATPTSLRTSGYDLGRNSRMILKLGKLQYSGSLRRES